MKSKIASIRHQFSSGKPGVMLKDNTSMKLALNNKIGIINHSNIGISMYLRHIENRVIIPIQTAGTSHGWLKS